MDLLEVAFTAEFLGPSGKPAIPRAVIIEGDGRKQGSVEFSREFPPAIEQMPEGDAKNEAMQKFMSCLYTEPGKEPCPLTTGEKLLCTSSFIAPKDYTNLKFSFGDVPPIPVNPPQN